MGKSNYLEYSLDMVLCIDATASMVDVIDLVKQNALNFYDDLVAVMKEQNKHVNSIRVKVIAFRDYVADGRNAMLATNFFTLPDQNAEFRKCVNSIIATGGGDEPEDGLEALAYAIRSSWNTNPGKKRQVIVVWTDASTHEIGFGAKSPYYPKNMARNFAELSEWWGDRTIGSDFIDQNAKRLCLFAPEEFAWNVISDNWDNVVHYPSEAGNGLGEIQYSTILDVIAHTV